MVHQLVLSARFIILWRADGEFTAGRSWDSTVPTKTMLSYFLQCQQHQACSNQMLYPAFWQNQRPEQHWPLQVLVGYSTYCGKERPHDPRWSADSSTKLNILFIGDFNLTFQGHLISTSWHKIKGMRRKGRISWLQGCWRGSLAGYSYSVISEIHNLVRCWTKWWRVTARRSWD